MIRKSKQLIQEGDYLAVVEVDEIQTDDAWSPYLSLEDGLKLDNVRRALQSGDLSKASQLARVYRLTPVNAA